MAARGRLYRGEFPIPVSIGWAEPPDSDRDSVVIEGREGHYLKLQLRSLTLLGHICSPIVDGKRARRASLSQRSYAVHGLKIGGSSRSRANRASSSSSNRQPGRTVLRLSLATTISATDSPNTNCSSAIRITLLFFRIRAPSGFRCCLKCVHNKPQLPT